MTETGNNAGNGAEQRRPSASEAELVADLKPTGVLERMMIQQMARAHDTTMACFDRAETAGETAAESGVREVELRLAARFMALFMQQAGALDRRRAQVRQAEEAARRETFDGTAAQTRARMAHWEENLRQLEGATGGGEDPHDLDDLESLDDLEALQDPAALRAMAERLGLPSPVDADGHIDPDALAALAERAQDLLPGGPGAGLPANGAGKDANGAG